VHTDPGSTTENTIHKAPGGRLRDDSDWNQVRWGRDRHEAFHVGKFLQAPPFFFTADGNSLPLVDLYRGRSVFIIASGPSFADDKAYPKDLLRQPGITTFGLNNSPRTFRPDMWACVDTPSNFIRSIWLDPKIMKFAPICHTQKKLLNNDSARDNGTLFTEHEKWEWMDTRVMDCPNMVYYRRNEHFRAEQYLWEDTINWGSHKNYGGGRSILLAVVRLCYLLGFRRIFLLGVDFEMTKDQHYSFAQHRHKSSVAGNNSTYKMLMDRFGKLKPYFEAEGLEIFNCNPNSQLTVFPHAPFQEAVHDVQEQEMFGINYAAENTEGLYDRDYREKQKKEKEEKSKEMAEAERKAGAARALYSDEERQDAKERLDRARGLLDDAKQELEAVQRMEPAAGPDHDAWEEKRAEADRLVDDARKEFRALEDEKRWKHGEPIKWKLWTPDRGA